MAWSDITLASITAGDERISFSSGGSNPYNPEAYTIKLWRDDNTSDFIKVEAPGPMQVFGENQSEEFRFTLADAGGTYVGKMDATHSDANAGANIFVFEC